MRIVQLVVVPSVRVVGIATTMKIFPIGSGTILIIPVSTTILMSVAVMHVFGSTLM